MSASSQPLSSSSRSLRRPVSRRAREYGPFAPGSTASFTTGVDGQHIPPEDRLAVGLIPFSGVWKLGSNNRPLSVRTHEVDVVVSEPEPGWRRATIWFVVPRETPPGLYLAALYGPSFRHWVGHHEPLIVASTPGEARLIERTTTLNLRLYYERRAAGATRAQLEKAWASIRSAYQRGAKSAAMVIRLQRELRKASAGPSRSWPTLPAVALAAPLMAGAYGLRRIRRP